LSSWGLDKYVLGNEFIHMSAASSLPLSVRYVHPLLIVNLNPM